MKLFKKKSQLERKPDDIIQKATMEVQKLFESIGLSENLLKQIRLEPSTEPGRILLSVEINAPVYEEIFFMRGGKICALLQSFAQDLPGEIEEQKIEWLFTPLVQKTAGAFDTGLLGRTIDNIGDWAVEHHVPELVTGYFVAKHIWGQMVEAERKREEAVMGRPLIRL